MPVERRCKNAAAFSILQLKRVAFALACLAILLCRSVFPLEPEAGAVFVRVVDTGAGLCCVIKTADNHYIVYDAGHWAGDGFRAGSGLQQLHPEASDVSLMVLSHTDSDHLGGVKRICSRCMNQNASRESKKHSPARPVLLMP